MTEILTGALLVLTAILWIWAIRDVYKASSLNVWIKITWILAIFCFPILGSIIYFQLKDRNRTFRPQFNRSYN